MFATMKTLNVTFFLFVLSLSLAALADNAAPESKFIFDSPTNRVVRSGWVNVDSSHYLQGRKLTPEYLNDRIVVVHRWCLACPKIEGAIKEFSSLKSPGGDVVFMTSYFPGAPHSRDEVFKCMKVNKVQSSTYIGAAVESEKLTKLHRATYVILPGGEMVWSKDHNVCIDELKSAIFKNLPEWRVKVIETLADSRPGLALMRLKELKKLHPKAGPVPKEVRDKLENKFVISLADFEKTIAALLPKTPANKIKGIKARLEKFNETCPEEYQGEVEKMLRELELFE